MTAPPSDSGQEFLDAWPAEHLSVAVVTPSGIVSSIGALDRRYRLASVTKPLVATAVLLAVEEGALSLDDPAGPPGATIRHLLSHASGIAPDDDTVFAQPATRRIYSNQGYAVLGAALEAATGMSAAEYLRDGVFAPLGMAATALEGHAGHGAFSTAGDLAAFLGAWLVPNTLLDASTMADATTPQFEDLSGVLPGYGSQSPNTWGLGFEIRDHKSPHWTGSLNSPRTFGHFGQAGTYLWVDPERQLGVVALGDVDFGPWASDLWPGLNDAIIGHFAS